MLLLIFFLITSQFVIQTGVKVKLPGSKENEQVSITRLVVSITEQKRIYVGAEETSVDGLAGKIEKILATTSERNLIIRADKSVDIDMVIKVIDAAKGIGIDKFTIETEKQSF
jgi:biopolymer transport protein ExbD